MTRCEETTVVEGGFYIDLRLCLLTNCPFVTLSFFVVTSLIYSQVLVFNNSFSFNRIGL